MAGVWAPNRRSTATIPSSRGLSVGAAAGVRPPKKDKCALGLASKIEVMSITVTIPDDLADRVARVAAEGGISFEEVVARVLAAHLADEGTRPRSRRLAFAGIGASTSGRTAAHADEMLAEGFGRD